MTGRGGHRLRNPIVGISTGGPYLRDGDRVTLWSWDSNDEQYTIKLEHDEGGFWALDGAIATSKDDEVVVYR